LSIFEVFSSGVTTSGFRDTLAHVDLKGGEDVEELLQARKIRR
jgi:hypothetical protein